MSLPPELSGHASELMRRHGYSVDSSGEGPHTNVLGHPLFDLVSWVDSATGDVSVDLQVVDDICLSSLLGYLSVRADDDFFDGDWGNAEATMMISTVFRVRHQSLLATHVSDRRFWKRFDQVWHGYAEAMLKESRLLQPSSVFEPEDFELVLDRSQPLEIPACAVLATKGRWDLAPSVELLVRHLTRATQIFDDFVDAPSDLAAGNYTLTVRMLGGLESEATMRREMVSRWDETMARVAEELDSASALAGEMGIRELAPWAEARKQAINQASETMFSTLFEYLNRN